MTDSVWHRGESDFLSRADNLFMDTKTGHISLNVNLSLALCFCLAFFHVLLYTVYYTVYQTITLDRRPGCFGAVGVNEQFFTFTPCPNLENKSYLSNFVKLKKIN